MKWYDELSRPLLKYNTDDDRSFIGMRHQLETQVVHLYQELLLCLIKSVCSYYRNRFLGFLRDTLKLDGWDGGLKNIEDAEKAFQQDSSVYNTQKNTTNIETLADIAKHSEEIDCLRHLRVSDPRDDKKRIETGSSTMTTFSGGAQTTKADYFGSRATPAKVRQCCFVVSLIKYRERVPLQSLYHISSAKQPTLGSILPQLCSAD